MTVRRCQKVPGHDRVGQHRFLAPYRDRFTQRGDGSSWPRWRDTGAASDAYLRGLLGPGSGKSLHGIAKRVGLEDDRIERFVRESPWEPAAVQDHLVGHVPAEIRSDRAALIVDDVALVKKGRMSVAAYRQWCGATGKVDECQVAVDLIYASPGRRRNADQRTWPLGMQLYVPGGWLRDPGYAAARDRAHLPPGIRFRTKHEIALDLVDRARDLPHAVVVGDAGYGDSAELRRALRDRREAYILGVNPSTLRVIGATVPVARPAPGPRGGRPRTAPVYPGGIRAESPRTLARRVPAWTRVEWAEGTKGVLSGLFWRTRVRVTRGAKDRRRATDEVAWLLLEKRPNELKAYLGWGLDDASLEALVAWAHLRWTVEQFHREAKQMLGLDEFEGRTWKGWHHHVTMVLLAYAYLALQRARRGGGPLPTLPRTANALVLEMATQRLLQRHRLTRTHAKWIARTMLEGFTEWED